MARSRIIPPRPRLGRERLEQLKDLEEEEELLRIVKRTNTNGSFQTDNDVFSTSSSSRYLKSTGSSDTQPSDERPKRINHLPPFNYPTYRPGSTPPLYDSATRGRSIQSEKSDKSRKEPVWRRRLSFGGPRKKTESPSVNEDQGRAEMGRSIGSRRASSTPVTEECSMDSSTLSSAASIKKSFDRDVLNSGRKSIQTIFRKQRKAGVASDEKVDTLDPMTVLNRIMNEADQNEEADDLSRTLLLGHENSLAVSNCTSRRSSSFASRLRKLSSLPRLSNEPKSTSGGFLSKSRSGRKKKSKKKNKKSKTANQDRDSEDDVTPKPMFSPPQRADNSRGEVPAYSMANRGGFSLATPSFASQASDSTFLSDTAVDNLYLVGTFDIDANNNEDEDDIVDKDDTVVTDGLRGDRILGRALGRACGGNFDDDDDDDNDDDETTKYDEDGCHATFGEDLQLMQSVLAMCRAPCVSPPRTHTRGRSSRRLFIAPSRDSTMMESYLTEDNSSLFY